MINIFSNFEYINNLKIFIPRERDLDKELLFLKKTISEALFCKRMN